MYCHARRMACCLRLMTVDVEAEVRPCDHEGLKSVVLSGASDVKFKAGSSFDGTRWMNDIHWRVCGAKALRYENVSIHLC